MTKYGMATKRQSSTSEVTSNPGAVITRSNKGSIDSFLPITGHKLNGHNYLQWSQSMMMFICGKSKDDHLTRAVTIPKKEDPAFKVWKSEYNMVMSWLINSMTNEIGENFLPYGTTKEIWDAAKETYSSSENASELFSVESILHEL